MAVSRVVSTVASTADSKAVWRDYLMAVKMSASRADLMVGMTVYTSAVLRVSSWVVL